MTLQEKLSAQNGNEHRIHLFKEGKFWKAYESSAFLFVTYIKKYKVQKKMVKYLSMPVVSLGFPEEVYQSVVGNIEMLEVNERYRILSSEQFLFSMNEFTEWKEEQPLIMEAGTVQLQSKPLSQVQESKSVTIIEAEVLEQIKSFGIESSTPIECMMFLMQIRKKLYGTL
ncbi:hypothetical protein [Bacteroides sp. 224]|uniref:hypothetical protein n=1 Tax=Bacteroides sp. 224 TaxID=2302936 RepID=UPI0013D88F65|nr:hypothetical protein [Bacteroides sp. 224]NDV66417.1 hypothetical protein [Bacteroides sp. 224]